MWEEEQATPGMWLDRFPELTEEEMKNKVMYQGSFESNALTRPGLESVYFLDCTWYKQDAASLPAFQGAYFCGFNTQYFLQDGAWQRHSPLFGGENFFYQPREFDENGYDISRIPEDYLPTGEPAYTYDELRAAIQEALPVS